VQGFRIAVHRITGQIEILKSVHAADAGTFVNLMQCTGQVEGGVTQGIGWALIKRMIMATQGQIVNPTFRNYRIPAFVDTPRTEVYFANTYDKIGPMGAKSMSESPINPVAPALANALADATGIRFARVPFTAPRIFERLLQNSAIRHQSVASPCPNHRQSLTKHHPASWIAFSS
jgi:CO/xanthine dehydrogenase Mo-binding subunit